ncbi:hypothetical protein [Solicola gregarius]|uniref:Lipoprotein n=1 Tax=Solicola gregarius TaxID=2908642 RepID=A0AA46TMK5_9ACTN|nr:hypothetical protein [Solicola gregarius]UYM07699.1 hypothetical protein L0C25_11700 [Solicola gregarius]
MMHRRSALAVVLGALLLSGCFAGGEKADVAKDPFAPLPKVEHAKVEVPKDRDPRAVEEALRRIDPCALVRPARGSHPAFPAAARPSREGPHSCEVEAVNGYHGEIEVRLGEVMAADDRYAWRRIDVGGSAVYANADGGGFCQLAIPVSFEHTILFTVDLYKYAGGWAAQPCVSAKRLVSRAIPILRTPAAIPKAPGPGRWSACDLLAQTLDGQIPPKHVVRMGDGVDGIDECRLYRADKSSLALTGASFGPIDTGIAARLVYDPDSARKKDTAIGGHAVEIMGKKPCEYSWRQWPTVSDSDYPGVVVLSAPTCRQVERMSRIAMRALDGPPAQRSDTAPQRPLLYEFGESDVPAVDACMDLNPGERVDCRPYVEADLPDEPAEVVRHAEADRNVNCALAIDAVRRNFGRQMIPVTVGAEPAVGPVDVTFARPQSCVFVEPEHGLEVWVQAASASLYNTISEVGDERVAGHRASVDRVSEYSRFTAIALGRASDPGQLIVGVTRQPSEAGRSRAAERRLDRIDSLAAELVEEHF